ncbi:MAG TPA: outer membrane protein assembly factor BamA [Thermoanaerobaculia bacterium]|nr:outer membrane protein assembly factor BamA [Thermoanaerobaculia bacterium]
MAFAAALLVSAAVEAQTQPAPQPPPPQKPRPGTIIGTPSSGRITDNPTAAATPGGPAQAGQTIERFEAAGNQSVASDTIRVYLGINPGDPYNPTALQKNFLNLWQTGLFDDIRLEVDKGDKGVIVRAIVKERPRIGAVEYRGNKELTTAKISEAFEREHIDLHVGNTVEQTLVRRAADLIKKTYTEGGYEGVTVNSSTEDMTEPGEKKIVFVINEGTKPKIAHIEFTGNTHYSVSRLRHQLKEVKEHNILTWVRKNDLYIPSKLDEDLEHIKNFYQDNGYQAVSFGDPQIVNVNAKNKKNARVNIVIPVKEGPVHTFGDVTVTGNTVFTADQIIGDWPLKKGQTMRRKAVQTRADAFGEAYRMRGYIYAYVNPEYVVRDGDVVDVHMQVYEGDQFRLGRLEFQGNTTTKDKVLRREIFLEEGQIMDMETFKQSLYKLGQLGYFKVTDNPDFKVNQDSKTVDITVKGTEEGKNDIQFGGGYSEGGGFFVQSQFGTRNFLGEGENFSIGYQRGLRLNYFSLAYSDPWFMDTPNSLGVSVYNRDTIYPANYGYEARSRGGTAAYGYRLGRFDSLSFMYGLEHDRTHYEFSNPPDQNGNVPVATIADYSFLVSSVGPTYQYNSFDNPFDTTRGSRLMFGAAYSGGPLGGTIHMLKPTITAGRYFRLSRRSSFSVNAEAGYIFPFSKDCSFTYNERDTTGRQLCIPEIERFTVGGEFSVRGFQTGTLGPFETQAGRSVPVGAYSMQVYNFDYIFKINDPLRFVLWADVGKGYAYKEPMSFSKLRYTTGVEFRIFLPVFQFPLRFIYAFNPQKKPGDYFQSFQFTIGSGY